MYCIRKRNLLHLNFNIRLHIKYDIEIVNNLSSETQGRLSQAGLARSFFFKELSFVH